jgi:hypothetical protein
LFGPNAANASSRSASVSLSSDHSSWLRTNIAHWSSTGRVGSARRPWIKGPASSRTMASAND